MNYLEVETLEAFLYLVYGNQTLPLKYFNYNQRLKIISDINDNDLAENFYFTIDYEEAADLFRIPGYAYSDLGLHTFLLKDLNTIINNYRDKEKIDFHEISHNKKNDIFWEHYLFSITLILNIDVQKIESIEKFFKKYTKNFEEKKLSSDTNYYSYSKSILKVNEIFEKYFDKFEHTFNIIWHYSSKSELHTYDKEIRFYEVLLYLRKKFLIINNIKYIYDSSKVYSDTLSQEFIINITLKNTPAEIYKSLKLISKMTIGGIDQDPDKEDNNDVIALQLNYNHTTRQICINETPLKTPRYDSINEIVFKYLYDHPNKRISKKELEEIVLKESEMVLSKSLHKIAQELGFNANRKKLFLITSKTSATLRTKITKKELEESGIDISKVLPKK